MKKRLLSMIVAIGLVASLASCGGGSSDETGKKPPVTEEDAKTKTVITVGMVESPGFGSSWLAETATRFEKAYA
ncbi:MAG: hypothetical protein IJ800_03600, partial [Clostridia bacterium]|nr:hypothetical protein [Clostridia bacterium]